MIWLVYSPFSMAHISRSTLLNRINSEEIQNSSAICNSIECQKIFARQNRPWYTYANYDGQMSSCVCSKGTAENLMDYSLFEFIKIRIDLNRSIVSFQLKCEQIFHEQGKTIRMWIKAIVFKVFDSKPSTKNQNSIRITHQKRNTCVGCC